MNSIAAKPACAIPLDRRRAKGKAVLCTKGVELKQMRNILGPMSRIKIGPLKYHQCQPVNAEIYPNKFPANKKRFSEESPNKPIDPLMKDTSSDLLNNRGNYVGSEDRSASSVRTGVVKKVDPIFSIGLQLMRAVSAWYSVLHKDAIPSLKWLSTKSDLSRAIKILNIMCGEHQPLTWWKFKVKLFKWYFCLFLSFLREKGLDSKRLRGRDINCRGSLSIDLIKEAGNFFLRAKILSACGMTETYSRLTFMTLYDLHFPFRYQPPIFMLEQISIQFKGHGPSELANMHRMLN